MNLFVASRIRPLKNPIAASTDGKDEIGVEISVVWETKAQSARLKFQREERNQKEEERDEPQTKESDNNYFQRKRRGDETR